MALVRRFAFNLLRRGKGKKLPQKSLLHNSAHRWVCMGENPRSGSLYQPQWICLRALRASPVLTWALARLFIAVRRRLDRLPVQFA
jgi:hypothetical protein